MISQSVVCTAWWNAVFVYFHNAASVCLVTIFLNVVDTHMTWKFRSAAIISLMRVRLLEQHLLHTERVPAPEVYLLIN